MGLSKKCSKMIALSSAILLTATSIMSVGTPLTADAVSEYNYAKGLQYTMYLYDANMCGTEVGESSKMDWRDDCHTNDATASTPYGTVDVSGGFHDAGDHVKFGLPQAYAASVLGWGYYEFKDAYTQTGQDGHLKDISTYFADYFKKCTIMENGSVKAFCYQVGDGNTDHAEWCSPESQNIDRPTYWATSSNPATDIVANTVGALAFHYKNFGDSEALTYAKALYNFAKSNSKAVATDGVSGFYSSDSYIDDLMWAAASLYTATGDKSYLTDASQFLTDSGNAYVFCSDWPLCWGNMWPAVNLIFSKSGGVSGPYGDLQSDMKSQVEKTMTTFQNKTKAENVYNCQDNWGSARYNTAMQLVGLVYDKYNNTNQYGDWAKSQMDYLMGNNKNNLCYITGFSSNSVTEPHHRAATGYSNFPSENVGVPYAHTLIGALVGGPDSSGNYVDDVNEYTYTEVAIDYNAGIVGAMAGLYLKYGSGQTVDSSIEGVSGGSTVVNPPTTTTTTTTVTNVTSDKVTTTTTTQGGSTGNNILKKTEVKDNGDGTSTLIIYVDTDSNSTVTLNMQGLAGYTTSGMVGYWDNSAQKWVDDLYNWENQKFDNNGNLTISDITVPTNQQEVQIMITYYADWSSGSEVKGDLSTISVSSVTSGSGNTSVTTTTTTPKVTTTTTTTTTTQGGNTGNNILKKTEVKDNGDGTSTLIIYVDTDNSSTVTLNMQGLAGYTTSGMVGYWDNSAQKWVDDLYNWENQKFDNNGNLTISDIKVPTNQQEVQIMITYYADWSSGSEVKGDLSTISVSSVISGNSGNSGATTTVTTVPSSGNNNDNMVSSTDLEVNSDGTDVLKMHINTGNDGTVTVTITGGTPGATTSGQVGYWDSSTQTWVDAYDDWEGKKFDSNGNLTITDVKVPTNTDDVQIMLTYYADWSSGSENLLDKSSLSVSVSDSSSSSSTTVTTTTTVTTVSTSQSSSGSSNTTTNGNSSTVLGDVNGDGQVKSNDLLSIRRHLLHLETLTGQSFTNADVNKDGQVKSNDILKIRRYLLHLDSSLE